MIFATDEHFEACQKKLNFLPKKWKYWKTLQEYRKDWASIKKPHLREIIVETNISFDYTFSLYEWLGPTLTLDTGHKFICLLLASSIFEAVLNDYIGTFINERGDEVIFEKVSRFVGNAENIKIAKAKGLLNKKWHKYLSNINDLRNYIHPSKKGTRSILGGLSIASLRSEIDDFRKYIAGKY